MPFPDFSSKESGTRESRFQELVLAMRNNDVEKCLNMTFRKSGMNEQDTNRHNAKARQWASACHSRYFNDARVGKKFEKLKVLNQLYFGDTGLFIFGTGTSSSEPSFYRSKLRFVMRPEGTFLWSVEKPPAFSSLLMVMMVQKADFPQKYAPVENRKFEYEVRIPDINDTQHVAYLQFNGEKYDFKVFSDAVSSVDKPTDEVVSLFQMKYLMIKAGFPREALAEFYTDKSRERYLEWIKNPESLSYLEWRFKDWATVEKRIRFVVDATPLYIVLYQRGSSNRLSYSFIIRDPKDGKLKFANFHCAGFLDDLFTNQEFRSSLSKRIIGEK